MSTTSAPDTIRLTGLSARGYHGVLPFEREQGQIFAVDVVLSLGADGTRPAAATDALADAIDYSAVAGAVVDVIEGEPVNLIETLAERVSEAVLAFSGVSSVEVTVHKPQAPLDVAFDDVAVSITRSVGRRATGAHAAVPAAAVAAAAGAVPAVAGAAAAASVPAAVVAAETASEVPGADLAEPVAPVAEPAEESAAAPSGSEVSWAEEPDSDLAGDAAAAAAAPAEAAVAAAPAEGLAGVAAGAGIIGAGAAAAALGASVIGAEQEEEQTAQADSSPSSDEGVLGDLTEGEAAALAAAPAVLAPAAVAPVVLPESEPEIEPEPAAPAPEPAAEPAPVDVLDQRPDSPAGIVIALGGNVGGVVTALRHAIGTLVSTEGIDVTEVAPLARTAALVAEGQEPQPDYLNTVVLAQTTLSPREVLTVCQELESAAGRVRTEHWGPRTLDADVITYEGVTSSDPELTLPHPRAAERAFVLVPWAQTDPFAEIGDESVAALAEVAPDRDGVRWLALDWISSNNLPALPTGQYVAPPELREDDGAAPAPQPEADAPAVEAAVAASAPVAASPAAVEPAAAESGAAPVAADAPAVPGTDEDAASEAPLEASEPAEGMLGEPAGGLAEDAASEPGVPDLEDEEAEGLADVEDEDEPVAHRGTGLFDDDPDDFLTAPAPSARAAEPAAEDEPGASDEEELTGSVFARPAASWTEPEEPGGAVGRDAEPLVLEEAEPAQAGPVAEPAEAEPTQAEPVAEPVAEPIAEPAQSEPVPAVEPAAPVSEASEEDEDENSWAAPLNWNDVIGRRDGQDS